ncbi:hypothetical protein GF373_08200 [bacterium]|nr:hypothetical protein [bacterium]
MSILGLDIGTTGCKAIIFNIAGGILAQASREYPILTPRANWAEQDTEAVFALACQCMREVLGIVKETDPPAALALSCQGEAVIPVDESGHALRPAILGMDTRTVEENRWLVEAFGAEPLFERTGMPVHTINTLPKLLWLKTHEAELFQASHRFLLYEDFFIRRFTGRAVIGHCLASRTQMYDLKKQDWAHDLLDRCGIGSHRLAELAPVEIEPVGTLLPGWMEEWGLRQEVHVVSGGHDQACAALGSGIVQPGKAMVSTGTAEVVEVAMDTPLVSPALRQGNISIYKHVVPGLFLAMTLNHSGGLLLRWFRDAFCEPQVEDARQNGEDAYQAILKHAPEDPTSLFVLPHFAGSGTPWMDTASRGAILGLTFADTRSTIAKAILEGLTFELRMNLDLLKDSGIAISELHTVGGGAKSDLWLQLKADICQIPLRVPEVTEAACLGAAVLASVGTGVFKDVATAVGQTVKMKKSVNPGTQRAGAYQARYETYRTIYPTVKQWF